MEYSYKGSLIASHYQASDIVYRMNYRDALSRLPSCYVTITVPTISRCSEQEYVNVPRDVKV